MQREQITIPKLLYDKKPEILAYEIYRISHNHLDGSLIGTFSDGADTDITLATIFSGAIEASNFINEKYLNEWGKPSNMMIKLIPEQFKFLDDEIEISISLV